MFLLTRTFIAVLWGMWNYVSFNTMFSHHDYNYILKVVFTLPIFIIIDITMITMQNVSLWWYDSSINVSKFIFYHFINFVLFSKFSNTKKSKIMNKAQVRKKIRLIWYWRWRISLQERVSSKRYLHFTHTAQLSIWSFKTVWSSFSDFWWLIHYR